MASRKKSRGYAGFLVSFEGGDGAGKSTQIRALVRWLRREGREVVVTRQPGGSRLGKGLRRLLLDPKGKVNERAELLMYEADRAQHVEDVIRPALERGAVVVSDRFADSSTVYQGICRGLGREWTEQLNDFATGGLEPDLVLLLDLPEHVGRRRMGARKQLDRMEQEARSFHRKVRRAYLELALRHRDRFAVIDASPAPEIISERIRDLVKERMA